MSEPPAVEGGPQRRRCDCDKIGPPATAGGSDKRWQTTHITEAKDSMLKDHKQDAPRTVVTAGEPVLRALLPRLVRGEDLLREEAAALLNAMLGAAASDAQIA